ncbi:DUF6809 family protein [uncultured Oscillibacter sp.]|uniref:DUF6809 family protein n=1 Tax=uncultured Oscillibacter sp. TaxID=876091 RepID=UPI0026038A99|nr:DUF6809 family protein [uncultured Oscillibacter sp.]
MQNFLDALYHHAQESLVSRYLQTAEYRQAVSDIEKDWEAFRSILTVEQGEQLNALLSRNAEITHLEDEASFCSALSIGMELGRL